MKKFAIIVAAGTGTRMGTDTPKQFLQLQGRPILEHTLARFLEAFPDLEVILYPQGMDGGRQQDCVQYARCCKGQDRRGR